MFRISRSFIPLYFFKSTIAIDSYLKLPRASLRSRTGLISPDGLRVTYHLRRGIAWQDGAPLTSSDVAFSYHAVMNPANNVSPRIGYDQIASISTPDKWTVILRMKHPYAPIVSQFGNYPAYPLVPAHILSRYQNINNVPYNALPIGAGPYEVVEWARGDHILLKGNPNYWRGRPHIAALLFRFIANPNAAANQLQTGELDGWFNVDPNLYQELRHNAYGTSRSASNERHSHDPAESSRFAIRRFARSTGYRGRLRSP